MLPVKKEDHPTLATVQDLFDAWRKEKKHPRPHPSSLWEAALALMDSHSVYAIAKRLRLNYTNFKALVESRPGRVDTHLHRSRPSCRHNRNDQADR